MAYTDAEKFEMYQSINADLSDVVVKLQDFVESDGSQTESLEVAFARSTCNQLIGLVGNFSIKAKRCQSQS